MERILIQAHSIVTRSGNETISPGAILVEDGVIREVGELSSLAAKGKFDDVIGDPLNHIALPGFVNGHYHGLRPYRLRTIESPLEMLLAQSRRRRLPALSDEELHDHSLWTAVKLLQTGVTSFVDCFPTDPQSGDLGLSASLEAYLASGIRVALCVRCSDRSTYTYEDDDLFISRLPEPLRSETTSRRRVFDADRFFDVCEAVSKEYDGRDGRIRIGVGPTGPAWCSDELLERVRAFAESRGAPVQIHLLESPFQAVAAAERYGETAVAHLQALGLVGEEVSFAHCVWLTSEDRGRLRDCGSAVIHNPGSNLSAGDGIASVPELIRDGCRVGIGLDSSGFEDTADMFRELRLAMLLHRRAGWNRSQLTASDLVGAATQSVGYALRLPVQIGQIAPGMAADISLLNRAALLSSPYSDPDQHVEDLVVDTASPSSVDHVIVGGRVVVRDGVPVGVDISRLEMRVRESVRRYLPLMETADTEFLALEPYIDEYFRQVDLNNAGVDTRTYQVDELRLLTSQRPTLGPASH